MSRRKTKPDEIQNPEHYFKRYMAMEILHDKEATAEYYELFSSMDEMLEQETKGIGRKKLLQIAVNEHGELFETENRCVSVEDWLNKINNKALHAGLLKLTYKQRRVLFLRYYCEESQDEVARFLGVTQQGVSRLEKKALKNIKKILLGGCEKS